MHAFVDMPDGALGADSVIVSAPVRGPACVPCGSAVPCERGGLL